MNNFDYNIEPEEISFITKKIIWKLLLIMSVMFIAICAITVRLFFIQVLNSDKYKTMAKKQHETQIYLPAERGMIYDRLERLITTNIASISVAVDPTFFQHNDPSEKIRRNNIKLKICQLLEEIKGINKSYYINKINNSKSSFVWLERGLNPDNIKQFKEINAKGLILIDEPRRFNIYGESGSQIIGKTDIDNRGISGIEKAFDTILKGTSGYMIMYRDALGFLHPSAGLPVFPARNGCSIILTIDIELQRIIEYELKEAIKNYHAAAGLVMAIKPESGEILAMTSLSKGDSLSIIQNNCITNVYEPGSTFKLITAALALETATIKMDEVLNGYNGLLKIDDVEIKDDHPLNNATILEAMQHSSNIIFSIIANRLQGNIFYKIIRNFGFGSRYNIGIPGEVSGKIPPPDAFNTTTKRFIGFGYGISTTMLQILNAYSAIANDGVLMQPYIVSTIFDENGEKNYIANPKKIRHVVSKKTSESLKKMLIAVVENGTGTKAKIQGIKIAGKTGTTKKIIGGKYSDNNYIASFVGFFPAPSPEIAMIVVLDNPQPLYYGGLSAAPVFRNIALRWLSVNPELANKEIHSKNKKL